MAEGADEEDLVKRPVFRELFSGSDFILSRAFRALGWEVLPPIDLAISAEHDLRDVRLQERLLHEVSGKLVDLVWIGIGCHNLSRARDIPAAGVTPVRDERHPHGLPDLPQKLQEDVGDTPPHEGRREVPQAATALRL